LYFAGNRGRMNLHPKKKADQAQQKSHAEDYGRSMSNGASHFMKHGFTLLHGFTDMAVFAFTFVIRFHGNIEEGKQDRKKKKHAEKSCSPSKKDRSLFQIICHPLKYLPLRSNIKRPNYIFAKKTCQTVFRSQKKEHLFRGALFMIFCC